MNDLPSPTVARRAGTGRLIAQPDVDETSQVEEPGKSKLIYLDMPEVPAVTGVPATRVRAVTLRSKVMPLSGVVIVAVAVVAVAVSVIVASWAVTGAVAAGGGVAAGVWRMWFGRSVRWCPQECLASALRTGMWIGRSDRIVAVRAVRHSHTEAVYTTTDHVRTTVSPYRQVSCARVWWPAGPSVAARDRILASVAAPQD